MVALLDFVSDEVYRGFFVDLYVRCNNAVAISMYEKLGYSVYRRVRQYYIALGSSSNDDEDAFGAVTDIEIYATELIAPRYAQTFVTRQSQGIHPGEWQKSFSASQPGVVICEHHYEVACAGDGGTSSIGQDDSEVGVVGREESVSL